MSRLRDFHAGDRLFAIRAITGTTSASTVLATVVGLYLEETQHISKLALLGVVGIGVGLGLVLGFGALWASGKVGTGFTNVVLGAGNLAPAPSFSLQDSMVARGRYQEAVDSFVVHLGEHPNDHDARFALATILSGPLRDPTRAARVYEEIRRGKPTPPEEYRVTQALIDLHRAAGDRGRLMAELSRFAAAHRQSAAGAAAAREIQALKEASAD